MSDFVHLHNHSEYSLLDGLARVEDMVKKAKKLNMEALAITDHGNLYGAITFYKQCIEIGVKPIIGCEIYVTDSSMYDKDVKNRDYNHLILLAKNEAGYKNLIKIVTYSNLYGYYYKPRSDIDLLSKYSEGLICLSACLNGYITDPLMKNEEEKAITRAKKLQEIYGNGNFYIEIQKHINLNKQDLANEKLISLAKKLTLPLVATNDNHYINKSDAQAHEILLCIQTQSTIDDKNRKLTMLDSPGFYMKSEEEMKSLFIDHKDAILNTKKIADQCNLELTLGRWKIPEFKVDKNMTTTQFIEKEIEKGLKTRYTNITEEIRSRIKYELSIILNKKYENYFLVVADFVSWAKSQGISVGPGRGSAAGSLVSYALGITDVDPFYFKLPFERFLNPDRPSAPDIDLDFADNRRDEVIDYVTKKYGSDKVAQIITFGTMEARGSVRDAGRALGMPYAGPDRISKMIPPGWQGHAMTIESALSQSNELKNAYENEPETKRLLNIAKKLEGVARHASVHAAGVVIADKDLTEYVPLQKEPNGEKVITQYDMYSIGEDGVGLLKMDFLGLRNLTIIQETLKFIKSNQNLDIDFSNVSLVDKKTFDLLSSGETTGIFQLESPGMRRYIKELRPSTIFDLQAMVALYRPGPMANIPEFIKRKNNPKLITYPHEKLKDILRESYGIITYQDDVLLTAIALAGYSWLEADKLRKAVGKKIPSEMKKQRDLFIKGCLENDIDTNEAENLFDQLAPFAGYGFNKAHAACYATIAFRTAYLKANFPVEFMTALLSAESRGATGPVKNEKVGLAVAECKRLKINVLPPDINFSESDFTIEDKINIRFGLSAIKNVGAAAISSIIEAKSTKKFKDLHDFCSRVNLSTVNKKTMESLIKSGAMDSFGNRASLLVNLTEITNHSSTQKKMQNQGQGQLFDDLGGYDPNTDDVHEDVTDFTQQEKLLFEKEYLGIYLTNNPYSQAKKLLDKQITNDLGELSSLPSGTRVKTGALLENIKIILTKKSNSQMAFLRFTDGMGINFEAILFPTSYENYRNSLTTDTPYLIEGKINHRDEGVSLIIEKLTSVSF